MLFSCFEVRVRLLGNKLYTFREKMCIVVALVLGRLHQVLLLASLARVILKKIVISEWPLVHLIELFTYPSNL